MFTETKENRATIMLVLEEYVKMLNLMAADIFYLSKFHQDSSALLLKISAFPELFPFLVISLIFPILRQNLSWFLVPSTYIIE